MMCQLTPEEAAELMKLNEIENLKPYSCNDGKSVQMILGPKNVSSDLSTSVTLMKDYKCVFNEDGECAFNQISGCLLRKPKKVNYWKRWNKVMGSAVVQTFLKLTNGSHKKKGN